MNFLVLLLDLLLIIPISQHFVHKRAVQPTDQKESNGANQPSSPSKLGKDDGMKWIEAGRKIGIVLGVLSLFAAITTVAFWFHDKLNGIVNRMRAKKRPPTTEAHNKLGIPGELTASNTRDSETSDRSALSSGRSKEGGVQSTTSLKPHNEQEDVNEQEFHETPSQSSTAKSGLNQRCLPMAQMGS